MKRKAFHWALLLALLLGSFWGGAWYSRQAGGKKNPSAPGNRVLYYVDPMNPAHTSDKPGMAPCGMPMEAVTADRSSGRPGGGPLLPGTARITPERQQTIGIRVEPAKVSSLQHVLRALGRVWPDENRIHRLTASADGWVWEVREATTGGRVKKDQLLGSVYNFQFLTRQQQYLYALEFEERRQKQLAQAAAQQKPRPQPPEGQTQPTSVAELAAQLEAMSTIQTTPGGENMTAGAAYTVRDQLEVSKLELFSLGVTNYQIQELARTRRVAPNIDLRSPVDGIVLGRNIAPEQRFDKGTELFRIADMSRVWIVADVFEGEAAYIKPGMKAKVSLPNQGRAFQARVTDVPPQFDPVTRTLKVRLEADNPGLALRPDMFVDVEFQIPLPPTISVPADAVIDSGRTKTVFVALGKGYFEPRSVETGWHFDDRVQIVKGLAPGEEFVASGNFLIDSESRMKLAAQGLSGTPEVDVVSGKTVVPSQAKAAGLTSEYQGNTYYFSSKESKDQFDQQNRQVERLLRAQQATAPKGREKRHD